LFFFFFQAEDGIRDSSVTGVQTCALPISLSLDRAYLNLQGVSNADQVVGARSEERRVGKSVDLGGRRIIKKKHTTQLTRASSGPRQQGADARRGPHALDA